MTTGSAGTISTTTTARLQVSLSAKGLKNKSGFFQTSDPFAIVSVRGDDPDNAPVIAGHTNVAYDDLDPSWSTVVILEGYKLGSPMFIEVGIFDFSANLVGEKESKLSKQDASITSDIISNCIKENQSKGAKFPHAIMGSALFEVAEILGTRGNMVSKSLQHNMGQVSIHIENSKQNQSSAGAMGQLRLQLGALDLVNTESNRLLGRQSSPFFVLSRRVEQPTSDIVWTNVYKSSVVKSNLNPVWNQCILDLETLCNGDLDRRIKVSVYGYRKTGKHLPLGNFKTSVRNLVDSRTVNACSDDFHCLDDSESPTVAGITIGDAPTAANNNNNKNNNNALAQTSAGSIVVLEAELLYPKKPKPETATSRSKCKTANKAPSIPQGISFAQRPDFVDYLAGGCKINLSIAIDFTESNGNPIERGSLHYMHTSRSGVGAMNDYEKAIRSVCGILAPYDSDQQFPVWGFGAKFHGDFKERHCFSLGGSNNEEVHGVQGVLDAYRNMFDSVPFEMGRATIFKEVIQEAARSATTAAARRSSQGALSYNILLILTAGGNGNGDYIEEDKRALIEAADAPLSVVIVGIGKSDFSAMEYLDGDDFDCADNCQFVRFNDYLGKRYALTEAVLEELPDQLVDHFYGKGIMPGEPEPPDPTSLKLQRADSFDKNSFFEPRRGASRVAPYGRML